MSFGQPFTPATTPISTPFANGAENGLSVEGSKVVLGGANAAAGASELLSNRFIRLMGFDITLQYGGASNTDDVIKFSNGVGSPWIDIGSNLVGTAFTPIRVRSGFNAALNIIDAANVNIGNASAAQMLFENSQTNTARFGIASAAHTLFPNAGYAYSTNTLILRADTDSIRFNVNGTEYGRIDAATNQFLIGLTTTGLAKLHVLAASGDQLVLAQASNRRLAVNVSSGGSVAFTITGTGTPIFTFSRGITITQGGQIITAGNLAITAGNITMAAGDITTGDPGAGAAAWKLGTVRAAAVALDAANYVEVLIGGVLRKLALVT